MIYLLIITFLFFSNSVQAQANGPKAFIESHIAAIRSCQYAPLVNHIQKYYADSYVENDIEDGKITDRSTKGLLLKYTKEDFDPSDPITAEDCQINLTLGQTKNIKNNQIIFQTIQTEFGDKRVCNHLASNTNNQFQVLKANCKYIIN